MKELLVALANPWVVVGIFVVYVITMKCNPVADTLRDGLRAVRRYPTLWLILGGLGFAHALFQLSIRVYFWRILPPAERPVFTWAREAWRDPQLWLTGSPESLWWLPLSDVQELLRESVLPAVECVAGVFNNIVPTFPISALAALLLLVNWKGHHGVLTRALRKRFGSWSGIVHAGVVVCALAAVLKPLVYILARNLPGKLWLQWGQVIASCSSIFEYLFGLLIQVYLILLAYVWIRGLHFRSAHLSDFAIRRWSFVTKWAAIPLYLSTVLIEIPLVLKNFIPFDEWLPEQELLGFYLLRVRWMLALVLLVGATMQITLTFHSETLNKAVRDHGKFLRAYWWPFLWFIGIAGVHFFALMILQGGVARGVGEGTALWVIWTLLCPWIAGVVAAWLLASWVCLFKKCDSGRIASDNWIQF